MAILELETGNKLFNHDAFELAGNPGRNSVISSTTFISFKGPR